MEDSTTTRTDGSAASAAQAAPIDRAISVDTAFIALGRSIASSATCPSPSRRTATNSPKRCSDMPATLPVNERYRRTLVRGEATGSRLRRCGARLGPGPSAGSTGPPVRPGPRSRQAGFLGFLRVSDQGSTTPSPRTGRCHIGCSAKR
ncbi:hypothetical protein Snoj_78760 [Streptomyces nojiriensis]|uniref:Uncharacterized protein n=1 Tax=Streptomyces nojiriensis TaxID=66374 RepID=A0ABQ3T0N6_9ACTN|nr:hypothetical protein GCM10010205_03550 [Streptomyces nojiriensis]GHI73958.1 hypothetical protein Snoj_78760 [Streptomyces nojiriensis]